jgi:hypothetical protein
MTALMLTASGLWLLCGYPISAGICLFAAGICHMLEKL